LIVGGGGSTTVIEKGSDCETGRDALSVTVIVGVKVPALVGVPLKDPSLLPSVRPGGREVPGVRLQCMGRYPPISLKLNGP
jgi:hypothetical protein